MAETQMESKGDPFEDPTLVREALDVITLAEAMGLMADGEAIERLDRRALAKVARAAGETGIAPAAVAILAGTGALGPEPVRHAVEALREGLEGSPVPRFEWPALVGLFGADRLAALVGVSSPSVRRYASGRRATPDEVAARLHFLVRVVAALRGAYNDVGVRRWFERKRNALSGRSPDRWLRGEWDPDHRGPRAVLELARSLLGSPGT